MTTSPTYGMPVVVVDAHLLPDISNEVTLNKLLLLFVRTFDPLVDISYIIVYLNNPATAPELHALKNAYEKLDRRFKKNLHKFYVVPSTAFIDTAMSFVSPFISSKTKAKFECLATIEALYKALGSQDLPLSPECREYFQLDGAGSSEASEAAGGATISKRVAESRADAGMVGTRAGQTAMKKALRGAVKVVKKSPKSPTSSGGGGVSAKSGPSQDAVVQQARRKPL